MRLSVVIPSFNEEQRLGATIGKIEAYLSTLHLDFEIVVVDDGSSDRTAQVAVAATPKVRLISNEQNRGKGYSVRRGMLAARGERALLTDADMSTPIEEYAKLEEAAREHGVPIAFGSRSIAGSQVEVRQSIFREASGRLFNRLMRRIAGLPYRDTQCGFKLFDLRTIRPVFEKQTIEGFGFDVEILYIARKYGFEAREVPVVWRNAAGSKVGLASGLAAMGDLLLIRRNDWLGRYDRARADAPG